MHQVYTSLTDDATLHLPPEKLLFRQGAGFAGTSSRHEKKTTTKYD